MPESREFLTLAPICSLCLATVYSEWGQLETTYKGSSSWLSQVRVVLSRSSLVKVPSRVRNALTHLPNDEGHFKWNHE